MRRRQIQQQIGRALAQRDVELIRGGNQLSNAFKATHWHRETRKSEFFPSHSDLLTSETMLCEFFSYRFSNGYRYVHTDDPPAGPAVITRACRFDIRVSPRH